MVVNILKHQCITSNTIHKWYYIYFFNMNIWLVDYGIQPSATCDMIVTQGASIPDNVTGTVTKKFNRTTQALVPGSAGDIVFKDIWHSNRLSNKLNRHHTMADILSVLEVAVDLYLSIARLSACALWLLPLCLSPSLSSLTYSSLSPFWLRSSWAQSFFDRSESSFVAPRDAYQ